MQKHLYTDCNLSWVGSLTSINHLHHTSIILNKIKKQIVSGRGAHQTH